MDDNSIKLRLCNNKELVTKLIVNDEVVSNFDDILSNESTTKMIIEIYAVWIKTNSFGLLLRPINILMKFKENPVYNYKFLENSENDSPVYELSESHFQSEKNNINTFKSSKSNSNSDSNSDSDSNSNSNSDSDNKLTDVDGACPALRCENPTVMTQIMEQYNTDSNNPDKILNILKFH